MGFLFKKRNQKVLDDKKRNQIVLDDKKRNQIVLDEITEQILADLSVVFDYSDEKLEYVRNTELRRKNLRDECYFHYDNTLGYVWEYWERGKQIDGFNSKSPLEFRYLFLLLLFRSRLGKKSEAEFFMKRTRPSFEQTAAYQRTLGECKKRWTDFTTEE